MRHVLLTALGTQPRQTRYTLEGSRGESQASLCPIALLELLDPSNRPNHAFAIVTPTAREKSFPTLEEGLRTLDPTITVEAIEVREGGETASLSDMLEAISGVLQSSDRLTLDVTHGLRHMPFLMYALSLYVTALRDVTLEGAYYGVLEAADSPKPILNLRPLLELPRWFQAVEEFRDSGNAKRIAGLVRARHGRRIQGRPHPLSLRSLADLLEHGSTALAAGLTPEAGMDARQALAQVDQGRLADALHDVPLARPLADLVREHLDSLAVRPEEARQKSAIVLDAAELRRQLKMVAIAIRSGNSASAVGMLREWFVSWMIWRSRGDGQAGVADWQREAARTEMERRLGRLDQALRSPRVRDSLALDQRAWADAWHQCSELRNSCMHFGMTPNEVRVSSESLENLRQFAATLMHDPPPPLPDEVPG